MMNSPRQAKEISTEIPFPVIVKGRFYEAFVAQNPEDVVHFYHLIEHKWGLPVLAMDAELQENELNMRKDITAEAVAMLEAAGVKNINSWDAGHAMGHGIHEMGTARMGKDAKTSVLNANNQVWDCKNVFVTDGACMTSSACQNPSLTYMALTARAADFAVSELKKGNI
jgi:choline dehydrogenase-like flavoprotein